MIRRLALLGVGLIGGSLMRALKAEQAVEHVVGYGREEENLQQALELGVIDEIATSVADAVCNADMVVVAVPLGAVKALLDEMKEHLAEDAVVTDVGSVKWSVVRDAQQVFDGVVPPWFIPGHPIAGTENSGAASALTALYQGRRVILTPLDNRDEAALNKVTAMWKKAGAEVVEMGVQHHDEVLAATSHLPHLLAYGLVDVLARQETSREIFHFAAGGFRDFSRIASSNPTMWRDISLANRKPLLDTLDQFRKELDEIEAMIRGREGDGLLELFSRAKQARDDHYE
ncbi:MAG: prephenate dehydrogenase/arogenate dehydrogenase family protein [Gammaproteobacteria bacterium]|jgi:prephenate dehydrogenase|nr:prephenate dehydrogenase/arogenate dehydrogenase family protein [Gammaproteobacteria bacterium]MBT3489633.1 prephenate dehydrogenase/arogenate dehydrogenase family protein [Gammaproteobacteria bacterium]MBT3718471.1 prephenate dehydrogenase/arogenate dehydrogenase family protein [Gammaproteobacteria bacterium]MBT3843930.1 prephenate dehydrogenase/arogenate dehydrogenase family protein [Gammaproteobacteria bacterium]MBT3893446.1 prephenate dehydrogenase/arogenate dehydrogenase family protein 